MKFMKTTAVLAATLITLASSFPVFAAEFVTPANPTKTDVTNIAIITHDMGITPMVSTLDDLQLGKVSLPECVEYELDGDGTVEEEWHFAYDAQNRLVAGVVKSRMDGMIPIQVKYDGDQRLPKSIVYNVATAAQRVENVSFGVDANGRITSFEMESPKMMGVGLSEKKYAYQYNEKGQIIASSICEQGTAGSTLEDHLDTTATFAYDNDGDLESVTYADGRVVSYQRDLAGNLSAIAVTKNGETERNTITYDAEGRVSRISEENGGYVVFHY